MKNRSVRILSLLCAVILMTCAVSAFAEETPATPTDLQPAGSEKETEDAVSSIEVIITKTLAIGESWSGRMKKTKPAVLKLDIAKPGKVYVLVEGKDVWATVEKSDRMTENPTRTQTEPETNRMILSWEAEEGSYLITLGPVEPNLLAKADVTVMNQKAYDAWEAEQEETEEEAQEKSEAADKEPGNEPEEKSVKETEADSETEVTEPEPDVILNEGEGSFVSKEETNVIQDKDEAIPNKDDGFDYTTEQEDISAPEMPTDNNAGITGDIPADSGENEADKTFGVERTVNISLKWDYDPPLVGDTAHFTSELRGYEGLEYSLQWQTSWDRETWDDYEGATEPNLDVVITPELKGIFWRLIVYVEIEEQE